MGRCVQELGINVSADSNQYLHTTCHSFHSDNALMEEAYSEGVIPEIFLN